MFITGLRRSVIMMASQEFSCHQFLLSSSDDIVWRKLLEKLSVSVLRKNIFICLVPNLRC